MKPPHAALNTTKLKAAAAEDRKVRLRHLHRKHRKLGGAVTDAWGLLVPDALRSIQDLGAITSGTGSACIAGFTCGG